MGLRIRKQKPVAVKQHAVVAPQIEMAEPKLLVDLRHQPVDFRQPRLGHPEIEGAGQMQRLQVFPPR